MRILLSVLFSLAVAGSVLPASAHTSKAGIAAHPTPMGCYPWSGCRK